LLLAFPSREPILGAVGRACIDRMVWPFRSAEH